jgi:hypothetical protein
MTQFIVIESNTFNDKPDHYIVNDLESLIKELYEVELSDEKSFEQANEWFYDNYKILKIEGTIKKLN